MTGAVILVRHGEPALSRRIVLTAKGYRDWWARYELGGLKEGQTPPSELVDLVAAADEVFASTRERARQSAVAITNGRSFASDGRFIEAPLPSPPLPGWFRMPPRWWGVLSRFCWAVFNYHDGQETVAQATSRARAVADLLIERAGDERVVVLVAHGYFNFMIGRALVARGWRRKLDQGYRYWAFRRFERSVA
jgi:broad specificity phosphatase PhoE